MKTHWPRDLTYTSVAPPKCIHDWGLKFFEKFDQVKILNVGKSQQWISTDTGFYRPRNIFTLCVSPHLDEGRVPRLVGGTHVWGYPIPGQGVPVPGLGGGTPSQVWMVGGYLGYPPSQVWMVGSTQSTPPQQVWMVGVPGVPPWPGLDGGGVPGVPPSQVWMVEGYPWYLAPGQVWMVGGVPRVSPPHQDWMGYPPCYAEGGMPLAFTKEDFLVILYFRSILISTTNSNFHSNFPTDFFHFPNKL